ncbi:MAG: class I tRNA ligase family protein, partial [Eubacterium sp.]|nr:class I tRNA ligase family protein [Eubacterium sp.]
HIECSCISMKHLGENLDIHCGGVDNIFPHHTNEIAQSEAFLGHKWCNYWVHVNHLNTKSGKMSKSKGEFLTVSLLEEKGYDPMVYRFFCLQSHYRKPLEFSWEGLDNVNQAYQKLMRRIGSLTEEGSLDQAAYEDYELKFAEAMGNDINTSSAITVLYDMLKADISDVTKRKLVERFDYVLSLGLTRAFEKEEAQVDDQLAAYVEEMIAERKVAKKEKNFARADEIREELLAKGIVLKDTREGTLWEVTNA